MNRFNVYCSLEAKGRKTKHVECKTYKKKKKYKVFFFCFVLVVVIVAG